MAEKFYKGGNLRNVMDRYSGVAVVHDFLEFTHHFFLSLIRVIDGK